jgi:hypothetical protein
VKWYVIHNVIIFYFTAKPYKVYGKAPRQPADYPSGGYTQPYGQVPGEYPGVPGGYPGAPGGYNPYGQMPQNPMMNGVPYPNGNYGYWI